MRRTEPSSSGRQQRHTGRRSLGSSCGLLLAVGLLTAGLLGNSGCTSPTEDSLRELREYSLNNEIPLPDRTSRLMAIASNESESTHVRATAIQMLGLHQHVPAQPLMIRLLGGDPESDGRGEEARSDSERLRLECVIALSRFADPALYDRMLRLLYEERERQDPSQLVIREFVQGFRHAEPIPHRASPETAEILFQFLQYALARNEAESLVFRATYELRRMSRRPDLDATDTAAWQSRIVEMRAEAASAASAARQPGAADDAAGESDDVESGS